MKINETRTLANGWTITIEKETGCSKQYSVYLEDKHAFTGTLLECRAYAKARIEGKGYAEAKKAAREALEKKNSRPTESEKAHGLGMTIREYREFKREQRSQTNQNTTETAQASTETAQATTEAQVDVRDAIDQAAKLGLDLDLEKMMLNVRVDLATGEVTETARSRMEAAEELELWAMLWDPNGAVIRTSEAA